MAAIIKRKSLLQPRALCVACSRLINRSRIEYPAVKPKYPPGSWYSFSPKDAWKWYDDVEAIDALDTIEKRLYYNHGSKYQLYYFDVKPYLNTPNVLKFQEDITKSYLDSAVQVKTGVELSSNRWLSIVSDIRAVVTEEYKYIKRQADQCSTEEEWNIKKRNLVLESVLNRLLVLLSSDEPALLNFDLVSNVNLQTHWLRGGEKTCSNTFSQVLPQSGVVRYGYWQNVGFQLRNTLPLATEHIGGVERFARPLDPQPPSEALHVYHEALQNHREEINLNLSKADYNPHTRGLKKKAYALPHEPGFKYGCPSSFVNLSMISPGLKQLRLKENMPTTQYEECLLGTGLVHSFATSHAVAHYQGYDMHHDLLSPHLTQTILTDGLQFMNVTHQLNTLRLFVHDIDNDRYNVYSRGQPLALYHTVDDEGKFIGFNPDCVKMIGQCILAQCASDVAANPYFEKEQRKTPVRGDLLPYLPTYPRHSDLPDLDPGSISIPTFIRYTRAEEPLVERDLTRERRLQRIEEKKAEYELTKGPLHDSYEPPARGKVNLDLHFKKEQQIARKKRIELRDRVLEFKKSQRGDD
ncbi:large ribosomal subunit protein mL65-like [Watersipora subatra]|uniref:large ribosomal subunit protein mL65-like n=1 Tax=Watersipora subatra TaxID=2589382 RepID=UPI00355B0579